MRSSGGAFAAVALSSRGRGRRRGGGATSVGGAGMGGSQQPREGASSRGVGLRSVRWWQGRVSASTKRDRDPSGWALRAWTWAVGPGDHPERVTREAAAGEAGASCTRRSRGSRRQPGRPRRARGLETELGELAAACRGAWGRHPAGNSRGAARRGRRVARPQFRGSRRFSARALGTRSRSRRAKRLAMGPMGGNALHQEICGVFRSRPRPRWIPAPRAKRHGRRAPDAAFDPGGELLGRPLSKARGAAVPDRARPSLGAAQSPPSRRPHGRLRGGAQPQTSPRARRSPSETRSNPAGASEQLPRPWERDRRVVGYPASSVRGTRARMRWR